MACLHAFRGIAASGISVFQWICGERNYLGLSQQPRSSGISFPYIQFVYGPPEQRDSRLDKVPEDPTFSGDIVPGAGFLFVPSLRGYENGMLGCELHPFCSPASISTVHRSMADTGHLVRVYRSGLAVESDLGILLGRRAVRLQNRFLSLLSLWDLDSCGLKIGSVLGHQMDGQSPDWLPLG